MFDVADGREQVADGVVLAHEQPGVHPRRATTQPDPSSTRQQPSSPRIGGTSPTRAGSTHDVFYVAESRRAGLEAPVRLGLRPRRPLRASRINWLERAPCRAD